MDPCCCQPPSHTIVENIFTRQQKVAAGPNGSCDSNSNDDNSNDDNNGNDNDDNNVNGAHKRKING